MIWWNELRTTDEAASVGFYKQLIGWQPFRMNASGAMDAADTGDADYTLFMAGWNQVGGMLRAGEAIWLPFIAVTDVDKTCEKARQLGGTVLEEPFDVPGTGRFAVIRDPQGATFGISRASDTPQ